jgi:hypothetical protein
MFTQQMSMLPPGVYFNSLYSLVKMFTAYTDGSTKFEAKKGFGFLHSWQTTFGMCYLCTIPSVLTMQCTLLPFFGEQKF